MSAAHKTGVFDPQKRCLRSLPRMGLLAEAPLVEVGATTVAVRSPSEAAMREMADASYSLFIAKAVGALVTEVDVEVSKVVRVLEETASSHEIGRARVLVKSGSSDATDTIRVLEVTGSSGGVQATVMKGRIVAEALSLLIEVLLNSPVAREIKVLDSMDARSIADEMMAADLGSWAEPATFPTPFTGAQPAGVSGVPRKAVVTSGPGFG